MSFRANGKITKVNSKRSTQIWVSKLQPSKIGSNHFKKAQSHGEKKNWVEGETSLSDLSDIEFQLNYLNLKVPQREEIRGSSASSLPTAPATKNWVAEGKVTPVKSQGGCGSCWAFATIGAVEALKLIVKGGTPELYSEQKLVDCTKGLSGLDGCSGGWPGNAMEWTKTNGLTRFVDYPYYGKEQPKSSCPALPRAEFEIFGEGTVAKNSDSELEKAIAIQPVVVCVDASKMSGYKEGIFGASTSDCSVHINHAVLAVGYTQEYWLIKNSWGTGWGENGYIKISRNRQNSCGISGYANYPLRAAKNTDNVSDLKDLSKSCPAWAQAGYCTSYETYMKTNCQLSCSRQSSTELADKSEHCAQWAAEPLLYCNEVKYKSYMQQNCAKSCA